MPYFGVPIRNGLPIGLGSQAGFGIAPFDPRDLFSAGEQGAWYDPSDFSTLFTDSAGTTPVTGVEQFVGLMLDKSKGAPTTLGAELWSGFGTINSPWTNAGSGVFTIDGSQVASRDLSQTPQYTIGKFYVTQFTLSGVTGGTVQVFAGEGTVGPSLGNGTYTYRQSASQAYLIFRAPAGVAATVSKVSVREIPGNHATSTGTKRPKLAARYNLLTYSEQFDNGVWVKSNASIATNTTVAPDGTITADKLVEDTATAAHYAVQDGGAVGSSETFSFYAKPAGRSWVIVQVGSGALAYFNISNGALGSVSGGTATIVAVENGWFRCSVFCTRTGNRGNFIYTSPANGTVSYTGDGTSGVFLWGADLRPTSQATGLIGPTYQRVVDAATYDTAGFLPYLQFDGIDDSMSTGSIDFTATDKMTVFSGARLSRFVSNAMLYCTGSDPTSTAGTFALRLNTASNVQSLLFGSSLSNFEPTIPTIPSTNVLSQLLNIGAATTLENGIRVNGAAATYATNGAGSGNFSATAPLHIGALGGTSNYIETNLYSLIVRGAQSTQSQIEATESWVNGKTGAY